MQRNSPAASCCTNVYVLPLTKAICTELAQLERQLARHYAATRSSSQATCPSRLIHPTNQLAQGPYCPVNMNDQKYRPPETGNLEESSLIASPTSMLKNPVATQPQMSTAGPPYNSPWPYSPTTTAAESKDYHTQKQGLTAAIVCSHWHLCLPVIAVKGDVMHKQIKAFCVQCNGRCRVCL